MQELIAGRVSFLCVADASACVPQYHAKQLKILAVTSPERLKTSPERSDVQGKGHRLRALRLARHLRRARHAAADRRSAQPEIVAIVATPEYRELIEKGGSLPMSSTPEELGQIITQTVDDVEATIREFGMQQE